MVILRVLLLDNRVRLGGLLLHTATLLGGGGGIGLLIVGSVVTSSGGLTLALVGTGSLFGRGLATTGLGGGLRGIGAGSLGRTVVGGSVLAPELLEVLTVRERDVSVGFSKGIK